MKKIINIMASLIVTVSCLNLFSCSGMDDYMKYMEGGQARLYTGAVDYMHFYSGNNRVVFFGLLTSDPKISKLKIYWNSRMDSLERNIQRTSGIDTLEIPIPLPEGSYNFEVYTFDGNGNSSIPLHAYGVSYGSSYKETLYNRVVKKVEKIGNEVIIDWYNGDETSPFVLINYTDIDNNLRSIKAPTKQMQTTLPDYKSMSKFSLQTYYLPDSMAIDTFKVAPQVLAVSEDITRMYFKNPGNPFLRGDSDTDKWGIPKDWSYTPNIINQKNSTAGGWSTDAGGVIHLESKDWGGDGVTNGKIYQTFTLPAGIYSVEFYSDGGGSSNFNGRFLAVEGTTLPDVEQADQSLAVHSWNKDNMGGTRSIRFTLDTQTTVSIGWVATFGSSTWMHINYIKLMNLAE